MVDLAEIQAAYYMVAATGVLVAAVFYILNLRVQQENMKHTLQTRQAQLFMSSMFDRLSSPEASRAQTILDKCVPKTVEDLAKVFDDPDKFTAWKTVWWAYEGLGVLVHEGLVDIRLVARYIGGTYKALWEMWGPVFVQARAAWKEPRIGAECEYLYDELMEFGSKNPEYHILESMITR
jgi:hypothetical protein